MKKLKKYKYTKQAKRLQKEMIYSLISIIIFLILFVKFQHKPELYVVVDMKQDTSFEVIQYYSDFSVAKQHYDKMIQNNQGFNPAIVDEDGYIRAIHYGLVDFRTKSCDINTSYTIEDNMAQGYTNGCYGADAAFLGVNETGEYIRFKQSGVVGWVKYDEVKIYDYYNRMRYGTHSYYTIKDQSIMHHISTDMHSEKQASVSVGTTTSALANNTYYSYDGHYFYDDYRKMIDDYRMNTYEQSVNVKEPYFNYYQYVSHRGKSSYITSDIDWYITNYLGYTSKPTTYPAKAYESQLYGEGYSFIKAQNTYGTNAMMVLALAINESGFGRSQLAIEKNNVFGHAAYDHAPNESANGYKDVASSIETHANIFLQKGYLNPCDGVDTKKRVSYQTCNETQNRFHGGFFGDKASGMNVKYASDPYWGEKAAYYYMTMDEVLGEKDKNKHQIKVLEQNKNVNVYAQPNSNSSVLFMTPNVKNYVFIVLGEIEGNAVEGNTKWYKIQSDATLNEAGLKLNTDPQSYSASSDIGYIPVAYVT